MKTVYIVGGNGFARECAVYLLQLEDRGEIKFGGILGHNSYTVNSPHFRGDYSGIEFGPDTAAVIGAAFPKIRRVIYGDLKERGISLYNLVAPGCFIDPTLKLGEGNIFAPPFRCSVDMVIGNANVFNGDVIVSHDDKIGNFNFFAPKSAILGSTSMGNYNIVGAGALILANRKIGNNNKISPLSVVYANCRDNNILHGNPAVKVGINKEAIQE